MWKESKLRDQQSSQSSQSVRNVVLSRTVAIILYY